MPAARRSAAALWDYVRENKDYPYYLVRDRFAGAEGRSLRAVQRGEGKVIELDGQKVAAFRDETRCDDHAVGGLHAHGLPGRLERGGADLGLPVPRSRFKPDGAVIAGPAETPLPRITELR